VRHIGRCLALIVCAVAVLGCTGDDDDALREERVDSADAEADALAFANAGLQSYLPFEFGREARQPDGSTARVGFRLAFATDPYVPEAGFFACQQLAPEYFWKADYQRHANTPPTNTEVVMVAEEPRVHGDFFEGFTGVSAHQTPAGLMFETPRGWIAVITPGAALERWSETLCPPRTAHGVV
jgi:hypothetical protein